MLGQSVEAKFDRTKRWPTVSKSSCATSLERSELMDIRSLIALSLIMALLQFKPAPMYILDEVDAALDLSHTQNIGRLIKTRFKGSQFIVVSLKDGMFNHANTIFVSLDARCGCSD